MEDAFIFKVGTQGDVNPDDIWLPPTTKVSTHGDINPDDVWTPPTTRAGAEADLAYRVDVDLRDRGDFQSIVWTEHESI